MKRNLW